MATLPQMRWREVALVALGLALLSAGLLVSQLSDRLSAALPRPPIALPFHHAGAIVLGIVLIALGAILVVAATSRPAPRMSFRLPVPRLEWDPVAWGAAAIATASSGMLWSNLAAGRESTANGWLFAASLALFAFAVHRLDRPRRHAFPLSSRDLAAAASCGIGAAAVGSYGLLRWQFSWIGDELAFFSRAAGIARGDPYNLFDLTDVYQAHPTLDSVYQATVMRVLGVDRWSWLVAEVLAVAVSAALIYLLATLLFGRLAGVLAAVALGASHYLMAFERIGYNNLHAIPAAVLVFLLLALAWRTQRAVLTWLTGCAIGLSIYTFGPTTFVGPTVALVLGVPFLVRPSRRQAVAGVMLCLGFFAAVVPGLLATPTSEIETVIHRESRREAAATAPFETFGLALTRSAVAFVANHEWHHHYVGSSLVDPITAGLAAIGLAAAAASLRRRESWLVVAWLAVGLVLTAGTSYLREPHLTRLLYVVPPIAVMAGLGGQILYRALSRVPLLPRSVACSTVVAAAAAIPLVNVHLLHTVAPQRTDRPVEVLAVKALLEHPDRTIVFVSQEKNNNLEALLASRSDFAGRFVVTGIEDLELPPQPCGDRLQIPWVWTDDPVIAESLRLRIASTHRMQTLVDSHSGQAVRAWLFSFEEGRGSRPTACFSDARLELEVVVGTGESARPWDVTTDSTGALFVAVKGDNRVHVFSADGHPTAVFGPSGTRRDRFDEISAVAIDRDDSLWVLDAGAGTASRFDRDNRPVGTIAGIGYVPRGLGLAPDGDLLIAVTGASEVRRYGADGRAVALVSRATGLDDLREPTDVLVTPAGEWFILDASQHTVWRLGADRRPKGHWSVDAGASAATSGGLAYHPSGHILVTQPKEPGRGDVAFFDLDGGSCGRWAVGGLSSPIGIDVDSRGRVLLTFPESGLVRIYSFGAVRAH